MIISLNWLKKYVDIDMPTEKLVELIGSRLVEVEETIDLAPKYRGIKIVEVKSAEKIAGSDHLTKCMIWDGKSEIQLVCGAPNVRAGMSAVWLPPGVTLPATYNEEPLVLDKRKIMGVESAGMLAAQDELDLGADHSGIAEIDPKMAKPGDDFAEIFDLNDTLLDIENKSLTHRPDCFGVIGFAREVAGILGQPFLEPTIFSKPAGCVKRSEPCDIPMPNGGDPVARSAPLTAPACKNGSEKTLVLEIHIDDATLCPRYQAVVLDGFDDKPSKYLSEMTILLAKSGMRSINPIVDVTNYLMLLSGQPLHAFDYDKLLSVGRTASSKPPVRSHGSSSTAPLRSSASPSISSRQESNSDEGAHIIVRAADMGEKLELLDGKTIEMSENDIIITSNNVPVALAGAMGGANTEIDEKTRRIIIESATFSLYNLRGTQFRHGIFSEAITRFTKGQPPALTDPVIREATRMLTSDHGMKAVSQIVDAYPKPAKTIVVKVTTEQVNNVLGSDFTLDDIITTLENVGFKVKLDGDAMKVTAPWWRTDIHIAEDIIEEVGRLNGYDNIPTRLPQRGFTAPAPDRLGDLKSKIRQILSDVGANEVLTYSFISEQLLNNVGQDSKNSYKIINSISPELQYVRQQILPSLFEKAQENLRVGYEKFALFEMNQVFWKKDGLDNENVPKQYDNLGFVIVDSKNGVNYYTARSYVENLATKLGVEIKFIPRTKPFEVEVYFEQKRTADLFIGDEYVGNVAEIKNSCADKFKLPHRTAVVEMGVDLILAAMEKTAGQFGYKKGSRFPSVERDMTFQVEAGLQYAKLENLIRESLETQKLWFELAPVSIYQGDDKKTKNISFKLTFASYEKTLTSEEIAGIIDDIVRAVKKELKGEVV